MIDLIAAAGIGGLIGFGTCAVLTMGKVGDYDSALATSEGNADRWASEYELADAAHTRCSDALETARNRIERALEQITPGANATVTRIGRILRGEQGA